MAKVLIVDDVRSEVQLIANALAPQGYHCIQASNGEGAVDYLPKPFTPDDLVSVVKRFT